MVWPKNRLADTLLLAQNIYHRFFLAAFARRSFPERKQGRITYMYLIYVTHREIMTLTYSFKRKLDDLV